MILVGGLTYWQIKQKALNGHRSGLSKEQLGYVGFTLETSAPEIEALERPHAWLQPVNPSNIDEQLEELAHLLDLMPGYLRLAREFVKEDGDK